MVLNISKSQAIFFVGIFFLLLLAFAISLTNSQAEGRVPNSDDCKNVREVASLLPPHITAYFGMDNLSNVENIKGDLNRSLSQQLAQNKERFSWKSIDFEEIILECQLIWRDNKVNLFKKIQVRVNLLSNALNDIKTSYPNMSSLEAGQWLGEGFRSSQIKRYKDRGMTPFQARLEKMRKQK
ncbi:MAG: hypothetical protein HQL71_08765 [Magnetococcales bacterium]|nr:hypothetical protein [Magnetococcales bacterium]